VAGGPGPPLPAPRLLARLPERRVATGRDHLHERLQLQHLGALSLKRFEALQPLSKLAADALAITFGTNGGAPPIQRRAAWAKESVQ
jgi:hypothetical protein